ncbi:MAG: alpha-N-acetylglucosaminidase TIM-barrel domain-containing protein, partial [Mucinivorans sp.]
MKTITTTLLLILTLASTAQTKQAKEVITRFAKGAKVELYMIDKQTGCDVFETSSDGNKITIKGSSGTALCRGFYDFVKNNGYGINSSSGNRCMVPNKLPNIGLRRVVAPVEHHFYLNVVTYGYSTPYWDWERWSQEIDYMALHGIDMPLALVANEAISARVWKKLGLTDEQIANYFVGPAHFPWMRMGNISGIDGPLPDSWHKGQVELQHKILSKMRGLGMKPICPAFAGFVPKEMAQLFPEAKIVETSWSGGSFKNWMVMPENELFSRIGTMFIKEWEKEFGTNTYYLADSFNEMEIPFPPIGSPERYTMLNNYGQILYNSIREANKDAVWVMQGWMFGYQRHIWEPRSLEALCAKVPDDKMLLLDEAVDYNKHFWHNGPNWDFHYGFYGKPWIYGSIPNMGGKNGMTGILDFYANGHLEALLSANRGRLVGIGMAPEGIENNEVIYELITDAAWSSDSIDVPHWLHNYSLNRYGACPQAIDSAWKYLLKSVYGTFTDHPRYNWQVRPGNMRQGSINSSTNFFKAIEFFASAANEKSLSYLYNVDLIEFTAAYIGGKMELKTMAIENDFLLGNLEEAAKSEAEFIDLSLQIDRLLESHPTQRMERWIDFARANGISHTEKDYYEKNARRIVTVWG